MPLVAAAVVPHAPVLVPAIASAHASFTEPTRTALKEIGVRHTAAHVDTVIVLTPHGPSVDERMTIISGDALRPDFRTFGDVSSYPAWNGNPSVAQLIRSLADEEHVPTALATSEALDYGTAVPLVAAEWPKKSTVIPIAIDHLSREMIIRIAHVINEATHRSHARIACIASADLEERTSHRDDADRPTPWERAIATAVRTGRSEELPEDDGRSCGFSPIAVLLAMLSGTPANGDILSFQAPFRVGYMVADLHLHR